MSAKQVFVRLSSAKCQLGTVGQLRDVLDSNFRCQTNDTYNLYEIIYYFIIPLNDLVFAIARYSFAIAILQLLEKVTAKLHSPLFPTLITTHLEPRTFHSFAKFQFPVMFAISYLYACKSDHEFLQLAAVLGTRTTSFSPLGGCCSSSLQRNQLSSMSLYKDTQGQSVAVPILSCKVRLFRQPTSPNWHSKVHGVICTVRDSCFLAL